MIYSRAAVRTAARTARLPIRHNLPRSQIRFATTNQQAAAAGGSSGLVAGIAGGSFVFLAGYSYYHFSGAKSVVDAASATKSQFKKLSKDLQASAPEPNEAIKWLRSTATSYAAFIPGAKGYVDKGLDDLEAVQKKHSGEVDEIVNQTYKELKEASKNGFSVETAAKSWEVIEKAVRQLGELAGDSIGDIMDNHPQLKEKVGGNLEQLKGMADSYGPDAKKQVEETYLQIQDVVRGGVSAESIAKIQKVIQEKVEQMKKLGDEAWQKAVEEAKPYLDKNPQVKEMVEKNADALKQGNAKEVFEKVKSAVEKGDTDELKKYVKQVGDKAKSGVGQSIEKYAKMIPGGDEIIPKLQKLYQVAEKRGDEAQKILKEAYEDIQGVLEKRIGEVEKLGDKAKNEAKQ